MVAARSGAWLRPVRSAGSASLVIAQRSARPCTGHLGAVAGPGTAERLGHRGCAPPQPTRATMHPGIRVLNVVAARAHIAQPHRVTCRPPPAPPWAGTRLQRNRASHQPGGRNLRPYNRRAISAHRPLSGTGR